MIYKELVDDIESIYSDINVSGVIILKKYDGLLILSVICYVILAIALGMLFLYLRDVTPYNLENAINEKVHKTLEDTLQPNKEKQNADKNSKDSGSNKGKTNKETKDKDKKNENKIVEIDNVPLISQNPELPTGCEATAATILLRWAGVDISKAEVATKLPKGDIPKYKDGKMYGANPYKVYVGDPFSKNGYGVFHEPIAALIDDFVPGRSMDLTGTTFENIFTVVDYGSPVILWATSGLQKPKLTAVWYDEHGEKVYWRTPEHAYVMVGYDNNNIFVVDPEDGKKKKYDKNKFIAIWKQMGNQAVTIFDK